MGKRPRIVIKDTKNKQKVVELMAANNKIVAVSETLKSDAAVKKNVAALKKIAKTAVVVDKTKSK